MQSGTGGGKVALTLPWNSNRLEGSSIQDGAWEEYNRKHVLIKSQRGQQRLLMILRGWLILQHIKTQPVCSYWCSAPWWPVLVVVRQKFCREHRSEVFVNFPTMRETSASIRDALRYDQVKPNHCFHAHSTSSSQNKTFCSLSCLQHLSDFRVTWAIFQLCLNLHSSHWSDESSKTVSTVRSVVCRKSTIKKKLFPTTTRCCCRIIASPSVLNEKKMRQTVLGINVCL